MLGATVGGALSSFAATPGTKPTEGNLTIHKYWAETSADVKDEGNGEELDVAPSNPAVMGIQFDVYQLTPTAGAPDTPPSDKDGWSYTRTGTELIVEKDATQHKYSLTLKDPDAGKDGKTNDSGELTYTKLSAGYYYVEENLTASADYQVQGKGNEEKLITSASKPFIVAVPMTNAAGDDWNSDVHVYPKNQGLNPEKEPSVPSVTVGDKVTWTISANVPSDFSEYTKFDIVDTLDKRLSFAENVAVKGASDTNPNVVTLTFGDDYTVTGAVGTPGGTVRISLTPAGISKLAGTADVTKVLVSFDTTVNSNIASDDENTIKNEAEIEFENNSTTETEKDKTPPSEIHTGEIKIDKTYSGGTVTESAQF